MPSFLLVPGFAGSQLGWNPVEAGDSFDEHWLSYTRIASAGVGTLALNPAGTGPANPDQTPLDVGNLLTWYYVPFADAMRARGWKVHAFAHDWRLPVAANAPALAARILQLAGEAPVKIVAHSRGGLVLAEAIDILRQMKKLYEVDRCITMGTPFRGSWAPLPWIDRTANSSSGSAALLAGGAPFLAIKRIRNSLFDLVLTLPGFYELLIDPAYAAQGGDSTATALYDYETWSSRGLLVNPTHLEAVRQRWLNYQQPFNQVSLHCIAGWGLPTYDGPVDLDALGSGHAVPLSSEGDTTVLFGSATLIGRQATLVEQSHCGMLEAPPVWDLVHSLLIKPSQWVT